MFIHCEFAEFTFKHGGKVYGCMIKNQYISENAELVFNGLHWHDKTNHDVQDVQFTDCIMSKVPQGLTIEFPNLNVLCINNSKLKKISKKDLAEYKNLKTFFFEQNQLEYLPGDLFQGFENVEWMSFFGNQLEVIEYNILDDLKNLKFVCFTLNVNYDKCYSAYPEYDSNASLDGIKKDLLDKFFLRHKMMNDLRESQNILVKEKSELRAINDKLKGDNDFLTGFEKKMYKDILELRNTEKKLKDEIEELKSSKTSKVQLLSGIFGDVKDLIKNDNFKDFEIKVGDEKFRVHKFLLIARCPIIAKILQEDPEIECFDFTYITPDIFKLVLDFIYTDEFPRGDDINYLQLFTAASRLKIVELQNFSATKIIEQINPENVFDVLKISNKYNHNWLRQQTFNKIKKIHPKIELKDEWIEKPERVEIAIIISSERNLNDGKDCSLAPENLEINTSSINID